MKLKFILLFSLIAIAKCTFEVNKKYKPTWESLDSRPNPEWFDDSKIGLLIHWGVYSVPAYGHEGSFYRLRSDEISSTGLKDFVDKSFKVNITYPEFAPFFTAALFDPNSWAKLFKKSGVKYVVMTGKHIDGYTLWPSKTSFNWNSMDVGPKRDLFGELGDAVRSEELRYGVYYSLYERFNPLRRTDARNSFESRYYVQTKIKTELDELINCYKPDVIWSMDSYENEHYLQTKEFLTWLFNESPVKDDIVVNDRWGLGTLCRHGGFSMFHGCYRPNSTVMMKYEAAVNIDRTSWGYNRLAHSYHYLNIEQILSTLTRVVSGGGNMVLNIGPTHDGRIPPIMEERLLQMGEWLKFNGIAIYKTKPWIIRKDSKSSKVYYTKSKANNTVFAIVLKEPKRGILRLSIAKYFNIKSKVYLITKRGDIPLKWSRDGEILQVKLVSSAHTKWYPVIKLTDLNEKHTEIATDTPNSVTKKYKNTPEVKKTKYEKQQNRVDDSGFDTNEIIL